MTTPRQHHFCPSFYLEYFTDAEGFIWAQPKNSSRKLFKSSPQKLARQRDFYALEPSNDVDSNLLEKEFSNIEGKARCSIEKIIREQKSLKTILSEEEISDLLLDLLCNLIYLLKSPFFRLFDPLLRRLLTRVCLAAEDQKAEKIIDFFR